MTARSKLAASAFTDRASTVRIAIVAPEHRTQIELESSLALIARASLDEAALDAARASLEFWRIQGAEKSRHAIDVERELMHAREMESRLEKTVAEARRARPADRLSRFGELVAGGAGCDQWIVAIAYSGLLKVVASSPGLDDFDVAKPGSALAQCFNRRVVIERARERSTVTADEAPHYREDKRMEGSYVCIPFEAGAIALASSDGTASLENAKAIVDRLAPLVSTWMLEQELTRRDALVRRLALRMFAAIDEERARIARDLHDDQAQLIAAVKIALEGRQDAARPIFEQVERELRRKTRELRPALLRDASLNEAIEAEFAQMNRAGITAKLFHGGPVEKISRPVEQLCFQVVREALSNVIRHARAKSVEVTIEKIDAAARVSIIDDGHGIANNENEGIGMAGMRERLQLMGGSLKVDSKPGGTTVIAEIPELS